MSDRPELDPRPLSERPEATSTWWESRRGGFVALAILVVVSIGLLFANLGRSGIWEPWEAHEIFVAHEYAERVDDPAAANAEAAPKLNWAVPSRDGRPVAKSLLKTWMLGVGADDRADDRAGEPAVEVGEVELSTRLPIALTIFLTALLGFFWLRRRVGTWAALFSSVVFVSIPGIFLGVHNVASEMLFVATTTLALMAFFELAWSERSNLGRRLAWGAAFGITLALSFLDQRLLGVYLPLSVIVAYGLTESMMSRHLGRRAGDDDVDDEGALGPIELGGLALGLLGAAGTVAWGLSRSAEAEGMLFLPHVGQWVAAIAPLFLLLGGALFARRTRVGRALISPAGALVAAITAAAIAVVTSAYAEAAPAVLRDGEVLGKLPTLTFLLENHLFEKSLASDHLSFDLWIRQIGFSLLPWVALVPAGLAYLTRATRLEGTEAELAALRAPAASLRRFLLVWAVFAAAVVAVASVYGHYFYPAFFPLAAAVGLLMTDGEFWRRARLRPLVPYAMGFVGCAIVLMLAKDLQRFPVRFVEVYLTLEEGFELPEDFTFGSLFRGLKYVWMGALALFFFGLASWAALTLRAVKLLPERIRAWRRGDAPLWPEPSPEAPFIARARQKEQLRRGEGLLSRLARFAESPPTYGLLLLGLFVVSAGLMLYVFTPKLTNHLSQRGVFETYTRLADPGEPLYRYQVAAGEESVYLRDVETLRGFGDLAKEFEEPGRFFAVIPRDRLAQINYQIRERFQENLAVLDARSGRLLLVSDELEEGEEDHSFVADRIVEDTSEIQYPVQFATNAGEVVHPVFDGKLEMLGYSFDRDPGPDGLVEYGWGEEAVLSYYFRVLERVPSSQKVFLHVDIAGNRINGDHYPNEGEFPTNYWLPGDIVKDVHHLTIDSYSKPGVYTLYFGLFLGNNRMKITPREAHDGQNRMLIGKMRVSSGL